MQVTLNLKNPYVHRVRSLDNIGLQYDLEQEVLETNEFDLVQFDLVHLLWRNRLLAHVWCVEDVVSVRPDLTDEQCWQVLQHVDRCKDASIGISWETLEIAAQVLFGSAPDDITTYIQKRE